MLCLGVVAPEARKAVMNVRSRYISADRPPAATMIGIERLVEDDLLLEIEQAVRRHPEGDVILANVAGLNIPRAKPRQ